jgi:hypothetical protein
VAITALSIVEGFSWPIPKKLGHTTRGKEENQRYLPFSEEIMTAGVNDIRHTVRMRDAVVTSTQIRPSML